MASYFSNFPNVYVAEGLGNDENFKYRLVKNIFRKVKSRDDLAQYTTQFEAYEIQPGETPSAIAQEFFDDPFLDWVILLINNITDVYEQWPRSENDLYTYLTEVYDDPDGIHHYETQEVLYNDIVFIKQGIQVNSTFRATLPDGTTLGETDSVYSVTNYEHEQYLNEIKRQILIPNGNMVSLIIEEFEDLVAYEPHAELDNLNNKKTELSISTLYLNNRSSVNFLSTTANSNSSTATTFDYGPTNTIAGISGVASSVSTTSATSATTTSSSSSSSSSSGSSGSSGGSGY